MKRISLWLLMSLFLVPAFVACEDDDDNDEKKQETTFSSLESPYLICAGRNPGGVGFDFEYQGNPGGANNMDDPTVTDFSYDIKVRTIKGEKPDGTLGGMPFIVLGKDAHAVNYTTQNASCCGLKKYKALTKTEVSELTFKTDDSAFSLENLTVGKTEKPLMSELKKQYKKLVIGDKWKEAAKNDVENDEPVWVIRTSEGAYVKMIVTQFPAAPAPTATGYIAIEWEIL